MAATAVQPSFGTAAGVLQGSRFLPREDSMLAGSSRLAVLKKLRIHSGHFCTRLIGVPGRAADQPSGFRFKLPLCRLHLAFRRMAGFGGFGASAGGGFSFGASSAAAAGAPSAPAFAFGAPTSSAPTSTPATSFPFGGAAGGFNLGGSTQPASQPAAPSAPSFSFGGFGGAAGTSTPAFGAPASSASTPASAPSFFAASSNATSAPAATPAFGAPAAASAPTFGAPASGAAAGSAPAIGFAAGSTPASNAPAASGGFSFGGASSTAAPAAAASAATSAPAATPTLGGFGAITSTSQPAVAAAGSTQATSAPAAAPGFSFAPPASSTAAVSAPASTPASAVAAAALVPLPATGTSAAAGSAASSGTAAPAAPKVPNQLAGKTLEDIIAGWQQELEKHSVSFVAQARTLAAWDSAVLSNRHALLNVEQELRAVHAGQEALERQLGMIETHQKEVHDSLVSIEAEAERMYANERTLMDADTQDRDRLYARAQSVSTALGTLATELTRSVDQVNELAASSLGDPSTPMGSVVRVLNGQLQALSQLEGRIEELSGQIDNLKLTVPMLSGGNFGGMVKAA